MSHEIDAAAWRRVEPEALAGPAEVDPAVGLLVALHGDTAALHDAIAGRPGAFAGLRAGLDRLRAGGHAPALACEAIVVADNLEALPRIVDLAGRLGAGRCVFAAPDEPCAAMAPIAAVVPAVRVALARCRERGLAGAVRRLPACLLGDDAAALLCEPAAADPPRSACLFAGGCGRADRCAGLPTAYVRRFGWEERLLRPAPRGSPPPRPADPPGAFAAWRALLGPAAARVTRVVLDRRAARYTLELGRGRALELELTPRDEGAPAFARSRSFDLRYTRAQGIDPRALPRLLAPIVAAIVARDDGALDLDPRRGLPPLPPR